MKHLLEIIKSLRFHKPYVYYSMAYGLSTLIVPLGVQFLVNNLALSGLWLNISAFIIFIIVGLVISQMIKHSQLILVESLQREIFCIEIEQWRRFNRKEYSHFCFEVFDLLKSFSKSYSNLIELGLVIVFGLSTIVMFHPIFLSIVIIILFTIMQIYKSSPVALSTAFKESDQKYKVFDIVNSDKSIEETDLRNFLEARNAHFNVVQRNSFKISACIVISQAILLALGSYLITINFLLAN